MGREKGITAIESVLIVATVAVIAFVGFAIYQASQGMVEIEDPVAESNKRNSGEEDVSGTLSIENEKDLEKARNSLDNINFKEELDSSELTLESEES